MSGSRAGEFSELGEPVECPLSPQTLVAASTIRDSHGCLLVFLSITEEMAAGLPPGICDSKVVPQQPLESSQKQREGGANCCLVRTCQGWGLGLSTAHTLPP